MFGSAIETIAAIISNVNKKEDHNFFLCRKRQMSFVVDDISQYFNFDEYKKNNGKFMLFFNITVRWT